MRVIKSKCPQCDAPLTLTVAENRKFMFCEYCGTKLILDDIEYHREDAITERERIKLQHERELAEKKMHDRREFFSMIGTFVILVLMMIFVLILYSIIGHTL